eukprot:1156960-Pelagomonas_calceolata.AAC.8
MQGVLVAGSTLAGLAHDERMQYFFTLRQLQAFACLAMHAERVKSKQSKPIQIILINHPCLVVSCNACRARLWLAAAWEAVPKRITALAATAARTWMRPLCASQVAAPLHSLR